MNCGRFLSTTILTTHAGTVSFNSTPSISPAASLTNNLYKGLPPTSLKYNYNFIVNYNSKYLIKFIKKKNEYNIFVPKYNRCVGWYREI